MRFSTARASAANTYLIDRCWQHLADGAEPQFAPSWSVNARPWSVSVTPWSLATMPNRCDWLAVRWVRPLRAGGLRSVDGLSGYRGVGRQLRNLAVGRLGPCSGDPGYESLTVPDLAAGRIPNHRARLRDGILVRRGFQIRSTPEVLLPIQEKHAICDHALAPDDAIPKANVSNVAACEMRTKGQVGGAYRPQPSTQVSKANRVDRGKPCKSAIRLRRRASSSRSSGGSNSIPASP